MQKTNRKMQGFLYKKKKILSDRIGDIRVCLTLLFKIKNF